MNVRPYNIQHNICTTTNKKAYPFNNRTFLRISPVIQKNVENMNFNVDQIPV
jgi:hypothetical protein